MTGDPELDAWRQQWQARDTVPADLRQRVEREIRAGRRALLLPIAVTVVIGGATLVWSAISDTRDADVLAAASWAFIAICWATSLLLTRRIGQSRAPAGTTTTAFLDFTIRACRGRRAAIAAAAVLYPIFPAFMLVWRYETLAVPGVGDYLRSAPVSSFAVVTAMLAIVGLLAYRRLGNELESLRALRAQFDEREEASERRSR